MAHQRAFVPEQPEPGDSKRRKGGVLRAFLRFLFGLGNGGPIVMRASPDDKKRDKR